MTSLSSEMICTAQAMPGPGLYHKPLTGQQELMMLEGQRHAGCGRLSPQKAWWQACSRCRIAQSADPAGQGTSTHSIPILCCYYQYYHYCYYQLLLLCAGFALPAGLPLCSSELFLHVICNQQLAVLTQHCSRRSASLSTPCWACLCTAIPCDIPYGMHVPQSKCT